MKSCPKCGDVKSLDAFYPDKSKATGVSSYCMDCQRARSREKYYGNLPAAKAYNRAYYQRNKPKFLGYNRKVRQMVLDAYGNACACCGETTPEFLGVDHVNNDGEKHRRELKGYGRSIYQWLKMQGFPQDGRFQLLCHNCNMAKGLYGGCPHNGPVPGMRPKDMAA